MAERHKLLLVDDHPIVRQGLTHVIHLEPDLVVCGEAESVDSALALAKQHQPALALVDLSLGAKPDVILVGRLREMCPQVRVLVLSMHDEAIWAVRALKAGACGYVMKQESSVVLMQRVRQALRGETAVNEGVASEMLKQLTWGRNAESDKPALAERELQVLALLARGQTTREIATTLQISIKTVDSHREHIKQKLGLKTAAELMFYAVTMLVRSD